MFKRLYYILMQRMHVFANRNRPCLGKVYMFHEICDRRDTYAIAPRDFEQFLDYLINNKKVVDPDTFIEDPQPDNVLLTFDDVYASVYENAFPVLKERGVPYVIFVCGEYLDREGYLGRDMIRQMLDESRCVLGSHNMRHVLSRFEDPERILADMKGSKQLLEEAFGRKCVDFAFPYGSMYACSQRNIADAGSVYERVYMTYPLSYDPDCRDGLPRINMNSDTFAKEMR